MTATVEELAAFVNTNADDNETLLADCLATAEALVTRAVGTADVPDVVLKQATLEVGSELFHRRQSPSGVMPQFLVDGASPVRLARDPMTAARELLKPFLSGGFA